MPIIYPSHNSTSCFLFLKYFFIGFCRITIVMIPIYFLSPSLKKSSSVNFNDHFTRFIRNYYDEDPSNFNDALLQLNQLRELSCVVPPDKHEASLEVMLRYFDQICVIDAKLPISEGQVFLYFQSIVNILL